MSATGDRAAGFTLIEMLVVIAILALVSGIAFPSLQSAIGRQEFATTASAVAAALREARAQALRSGNAATFALSRDGRRFGVIGRDPQAVPQAIALRTGAAGMIRFFPDGSSTGGAVQLSREGRALRFDVAPTTGLFVARAA